MRSALLLPPPGDLPDPGIKPESLRWQVGSLPWAPPGKPQFGSRQVKFEPRLSGEPQIYNYDTRLSPRVGHNWATEQQRQLPQKSKGRTGGFMHSHSFTIEYSISNSWNTDQTTVDFMSPAPGFSNDQLLANRVSSRLPRPIGFWSIFQARGDIKAGNTEHIGLVRPQGNLK